MTEIISLADSPVQVTQRIIDVMLRAAREGVTYYPLYRRPDAENVPAAKKPKTVPARPAAEALSLVETNAVPRPVWEAGGVRELLLAIPRRRQSWERPGQDGDAAKKFANKKFSHALYTPEFLAWAAAVTAQLVAHPRRRVKMPEDETALARPLKTPNDRRCAGCRRFYRTQSKGVHLAFCECRCETFKASHCVECRVLKWACGLPVDAATGEVTGLLDADGRTRRNLCVWKACKYAWGLEELAVLYY